jgi:uncharacterized protein (DUF427 family)
MSAAHERTHESVWEYPRPPRLEASERHIVVEFGGEKIAETNRAFRVLETSHPPVFYIPPEDVNSRFLKPANGRTFCEWKGQARYVTVEAGGRLAEKVAWYYPDPTDRLRDHNNQKEYAQIPRWRQSDIHGPPAFRNVLTAKMS